jgi:hypothetical protein
VLAWAPDELYTLRLIACGLVLRSHGWRVTYLGASTSVRGAGEVAARLDAALVVFAGRPESFWGIERQLCELAAVRPVVLAGGDEDPGLARRVGATLLPADPVVAATAVVEGRLVE